MSDEVTTQLAECAIKEEDEKSSPEEMNEKDVDRENEDRRGHKKDVREDEVLLETGVKGRVKWFNVWNNYGFIGRDDDSENDVFVHQSGIAKSRSVNPRYRTLAMGEEVLFDVVAGKGGMKKAVNVTGPDGKRVQGCFFYEQYMKAYGSRDTRRRNYGRGDTRRSESRPGYVRRSRNPRKSNDGEEKDKKRSSEKETDNRDREETRKPRRRGTGGSAKERKHGDRRRNGESVKNAETVKGNENAVETVDSNSHEAAENEVSTEA